MNLYSTHAKEFSDTRQAPWPGWKKLMSNPEWRMTNNPLNILDLGCGNGRFLKFLIDNSEFKIDRYLGVDSSGELLKIANEDIKGFKLPGSSFTVLDLENPNWISSISEKYNLIVAFGLMHHLQTFESRKNILKYGSQLLEKGGYLVITYWQFAKLDRYKSKIKPIESKPDDYTMTFGNNGATRFCHYCSDDEIKKLEEGVDLKRVGEYYSDGSGRENLYVVYTKETKDIRD